MLPGVHFAMARHALARSNGEGGHAIDQATRRWRGGWRDDFHTIVTLAKGVLASQDRGSATGQGVRRMLVRLRNDVARETPRGGSPTSFQGSIGAWPTISSRSVACMVCALMLCSCALSASSSSGVEASA